MRKLIVLVFLSLIFSVGIFAQGSTTAADNTAKAAADEKPKRPPIFRANKDQITQVQKRLKQKALYAGDAIGKLDDTTRDSIKLYQKENGLKTTGTLNRATLEKMGIELTDKQKEIPVNPNSYASEDTRKSAKSKTTELADTPDTGGTKPKKVIFRATKDQIKDAQKLLKAKSFYDGEETGKLDDATRDGLKKFQEANGIKVTGTLNRVTLEKMSIELTDRQKADAENEGK